MTTAARSLAGELFDRSLGGFIIWRAGAAHRIFKIMKYRLGIAGAENKHFAAAAVEIFRTSRGKVDNANWIYFSVRRACRQLWVRAEPIFFCWLSSHQAAVIFRTVRFYVWATWPPCGLLIFQQHSHSKTASERDASSVLALHYPSVQHAGQTPLSRERKYSIILAGFLCRNLCTIHPRTLCALVCMRNCRPDADLSWSAPTRGPCVENLIECCGRNSTNYQGWLYGRFSRLKFSPYIAWCCVRSSFFFLHQLNSRLSSSRWFYVYGGRSLLWEETSRMEIYTFTSCMLIWTVWSRVKACAPNFVKWHYTKYCTANSII